MRYNDGADCREQYVVDTAIPSASVVETIVRMIYDYYPNPFMIGVVRPEGTHAFCFDSSTAWYAYNPPLLSSSLISDSNGLLFESICFFTDFKNGRTYNNIRNVVPFQTSAWDAAFLKIRRSLGIIPPTATLTAMSMAAPKSRTNLTYLLMNNLKECIREDGFSDVSHWARGTLEFWRRNRPVV